MRTRVQSIIAIVGPKLTIVVDRGSAVTVAEGIARIRVRTAAEPIATAMTTTALMMTEVSKEWTPTHIWN